MPPTRNQGSGEPLTLQGEELNSGPTLSEGTKYSTQTPTSAIAAALYELAKPSSRRTHVHLASSERRAEEIARALRGMGGGIDVLVMPAWDCLPYDRASPSRDLMGRRMRAAWSLAKRARGCRIVIVSCEALVQKLPAPSALRDSFMTLAVGSRLERGALAEFAERNGYLVDDRIDEPGEIAIHGEAVDIFPADAAKPVRIMLGQGDLVDEIRVYDPLTQRSESDLSRISIGPASELIRKAGDLASDWVRAPGAEHNLAAHMGPLVGLWDLLPKSAVMSEDLKAAERLAQVEQQILEAFEARKSFGGSRGEAPPPSELYALGGSLQDALANWTRVGGLALEVQSAPRPAAHRNPGRAFCEVVRQRLEDGHRVVLAGLPQEQRAMARALARGLQLEPVHTAGWAAALAEPPGAVCAVTVDLEAGYIAPNEGTTVIAASDVLGGRLAARRSSGAAELLSEPDLRLGDLVLHEDHGVGVLRDLKPIEIEGEFREALQIEYRGGASLLVPAEEMGRVWRYGAEASAVSLDRLDGGGWTKRRAEVSLQVDETARELVALAREREATTCARIIPPKGPYAKFAARFPYPETPDQSDAIAAVLEDLASGRPMDRLVCGDVGFGKTEVALRACAAVALSGRQVAVVAPTTILARQHFEGFSRRFAGTGVKVAHLSRLVSEGDAEDVRKGLALGEVGIVIGTHVIAAPEIEFADLGLMIIDEEQKFGAGLKDSLRARVKDGHRLSLTATPIPRTMQAAMVGVQDVSVIASPPSRRRPIRTFLTPFDPATIRTALLRESRRGGQSFFVAPRIADIGPLAAQLADLTPELVVRIAHGELKAEEVDRVMVAFADGDGDVLLATNIIESGLDVPRANTMLVWRPDRFGLAQLHQLRGRVGRGRAQGVTYLLTDPSEDMAEATLARLSTLEAFDRLGSGLMISARDLDLRGGGDLVGDEQAGHVKMIGAALYQRLLARAVKIARGEEVEDAAAPALHLGEVGAITPDYVPDAITRINLYARLSRLTDAADIDEFEEELEDRFGALPSATKVLIDHARLRRLAAAAGVREVRAGPKGIAMSLAPPAAKVAQLRMRAHRNISFDEGRLIAAEPTEPGRGRARIIERLLETITP